MRTHEKRTAAILAILLAVFLLVFGLFIIAEQGHDCIGEGCTVCHVIDEAREILEGATLTAAAAACALAASWGICKKLVPFVKEVLCSTLISLKVKLSD